MVLGKKLAIFDWEWGPREGQKMPRVIDGDVSCGNFKNNFKQKIAKIEKKQSVFSLLKVVIIIFLSQ